MYVKQNIPDILTSLSARWHLTNIRPLVPVQCNNNYVAVAYSAQYKTDVVVKILIANTREPEALKLFNGNGCVTLLDYDPDTRGLLLEYIKPGTTLRTLFPEHDSQAISIAAQLVQKLHTKNLMAHAHSFPTINQWLDVLHTTKSKKIPAHLLTKAQQLSATLLALKQKLYLLHGDLHHENILQRGQEWIAIDPKGVIGPLEYEVGRFIMNPIPDLLEQSNVAAIINNRIATFSNIFGFEQHRLRDWTFVQAVLSACWTEQGGSEDFFNYFIRCANTLENLS